MNGLARNKEEFLTDLFMRYQSGKDYNTRLNIYNISNKNEKFYADEQWGGLDAPGQPTPVFNIIKRVLNYFISSILSQPITIEYQAELIGDEPDSPEETEILEIIEFANAHAENLWEKLKVNSKNRQWLLDAGLSGDMAGYCFWDTSIETGQEAEGDIGLDSVDGISILFGNPNDKRVDKQPYVQIVFRELVKTLREEAKANGMSKEEIDRIVTDDETNYTSGERGKIELENDESNVSGKTTAIIELYKKQVKVFNPDQEDVPDEKKEFEMKTKVFARKATQFANVRKEWNTKLSKYPVMFGNWDARKNSYHGQALVTGIIHNQIYINQQFALVMIMMRTMGFPKVLYNSALITAGWSNKVGAAIGVKGSINDVAKYMTPGQMNTQMLQTIDMAISYTKEFLGANDAALGDVNPDNATALAIVTKQAAVPLENVRANLHQFAEDMAAIWLDFMINYYGKRKIVVTTLGKKQVKEVDFSKLQGVKMNVKIDVGASSLWSENAASLTLDNLLKEGHIVFKQWLERKSTSEVPMKRELMAEMEQSDEVTVFVEEMMTRFFEGLPEDLKLELNAMDPEEAKSQLMTLMIEGQGMEEEQLEEGVI